MGVSKLTDAVDRIKALECPAANLQNRIAGILEDYGVASRDEIRVYREMQFDRDGAQAYGAEVPGGDGKSVIILAKTGMDDYVAKVTDAYLS